MTHQQQPLPRSVHVLAALAALHMAARLAGMLAMIAASIFLGLTGGANR